MVFTSAMWVGLTAAMTVAALPHLGRAGRPGVLLVASLMHMVLLSAIAWGRIARRRRVPADNVDLGQRLAMTGYLHTLVGVSAALSLLGHSDLSADDGLRVLVMPISAALGTSFVGWWMGTEMQRGRWSTEPLATVTTDLEPTLAELSAVLKGLTAEVRTCDGCVRAMTGALTAALGEITRAAERAAAAATGVQTSAEALEVPLRASAALVRRLGEDLGETAGVAAEMRSELQALHQAIRNADALLAQILDDRTDRAA